MKHFESQDGYLDYIEKLSESFNITFNITPNVTTIIFNETSMPMSILIEFMFCLELHSNDVSIVNSKTGIALRFNSPAIQETIKE